MGTSISAIVQVTTASVGVGPGPVTGLAASSIAATSLTLTWTAPTTGDIPFTYQVLQNGVAVGGVVSGTTENIAGLSPNTQYTFQVRVSNATGNNVSNTIQATTLFVVPGAPTGLAVSGTPTNNSVALTWAAPTVGTPPLTYTVGYRTPSGSGVFTQFPTTFSTASGAVTGLTAATSYDFEVAATNGGGTGPESAVLLNVSTATQNIGPSAPSNLTIGAVTATSVALSWSAPAQGTTPFTYTMQVAPHGSGNFTNAPTVSSTSGTVTGLTPSTQYDFQVFATNVVGSGPASAINNATTIANVVAPGAPTGLASTAVSTTTVTLSWVAPSTGTPPFTYATQYSLSGQNNWQSGPTTSSATAQVTGLTAATAYDFRVSATNSAGTGAFSAVFTTTTSATTPTVTFNPSNAAQMALSNSNLTATAQGSGTAYSTPAGVTTTTSQTTGKFWLQFTLRSITQNTSLGFVVGGHVLTAELGGDSLSIGFYPQTGTGSQPALAIYFGNAQVSAPSPPKAGDLTGDVITLLVDIDNKLYWFTSTAMVAAFGTGSYNNLPASAVNPGTGLGGISANLGASPIFGCFGTQEGGCSADINAGSSPPVGGVIPSNFNAWGGGTTGVVAPGQVTGLTAGAVTSSSVALSWNTPTGTAPLTYTVQSRPTLSTTPVWDAQFGTVTSWMTHGSHQGSDPWEFGYATGYGVATGVGFSESNGRWTDPPNDGTSAVIQVVGGVLQIGCIANTGGFKNANNATAVCVSTIINNFQISGGLYQQFGYYEFQVQLDNVRGFLFHWDIEDYNPHAEYDIDIWIDGSGVSHVQTQYSSTGAATVWYTTTSVDVTQLHIYGLDWQAGWVRFYIDGVMVAQIANQFTRSFGTYILVDTASYEVSSSEIASTPAYAHLRYYRVYAQFPGNFAQFSPTVTITSETITGLLPATQYDFEVFASNAAGTGATSAITQGTTAGGGGGVGAPTALSLNQITSSSMVAFWQPPTTGTAPFTYQLQYQQSGSNIFTSAPSPVSSPDGTVLTVAGTTFTDNTGTQWGFNAGAQVFTITGGVTTVDTFTANVNEVAWVGLQIYHRNTAGNWYTKTSTAQTGNWSQVTAPTIPTVHGQSQLISGLTAGTTYNFKVDATSGGTTGPFSTVVQATTLGASGNTGPAASGDLTAEFSAPTGVTILPQLWGVAMAGDTWNVDYGDTNWVSAVKSLNFQFVRQHLEDLFGLIFPNYNASPNWSAVDPWLSGFRNVFPNAQLQIGGAWYPQYLNGGQGTWSTVTQTDIDWVVSMWSQLVAHMVASGVTPTFADGVFNEPDFQGLLNTSGTTVSTSVVATVSAAVFNNLAGQYPNMKFTGPCTAFYNSGYIQALRAAFPNLAYSSFHFYNGGGDYNSSTGAENFANLIKNGMSTMTSNNPPTPSASQPALMNEYAMVPGTGGPGDGSMTAAVFAAIVCMICGQNSCPITGIWQVATDDNFLVVDGSGNIYPNAYLLSKAGQTVFGGQVSCTNPAAANPSGSNTLYTMACASANGFALLVSNFGSNAISQTVAFSHMPGSSTGTISLNMWQQHSTSGGITGPISNQPGVITQVVATAGVTPAISFPPMSNTILYTVGGGGGPLPPGPPTALAQASVTGTTATLSWAPPTTGGALDAGNYSVFYKLSTAGTYPSSPNGPVIQYCTPGAGQLTDSFGNIWKIVPSISGVTNGISVNGTYVTSSQNVTRMYNVVGDIWQFGGGNWYDYRPSGPITGGSIPWSTDTSSPNQPLSSVLVTGLTAKTTYNMEVIVSNTTGNSTPSTALTVTTTTTSGQFSISNKQIIDPTGAVWKGNGINLAADSQGWFQGLVQAITNLSTCTPLLNVFPKTKVIRIPCYDILGAASNPSTIAPYITALTNRHIVCSVEYHLTSMQCPSPSTSPSISDVTAWYSTMAAAFATNPYVWFEIPNEINPYPDNDNGQTYLRCIRGVVDAVRAHSNAIIQVMVDSGSVFGGLMSAINTDPWWGQQRNLTAGSHFYVGFPGTTGSLSQFGFTQAAAYACVQQQVAWMQQAFTTADGIPPVINGEYGDSTDGSNIDNGWQVMVIAGTDLFSSNAVPGLVGTTAWYWNSVGPPGGDQLLNPPFDGSGGLTAYGNTFLQWML